MEVRSLFFTGSIWICGSAKNWLILVFKMDDHLTLVFKTQSWVLPWKETVSLPIYGGKWLQRFPYQTQWPNFNFPQSQYFNLLLVWLRGKESHVHRHPQHSPAEARSLLELCVSWHKIKSKCLALNEVIWFEFSGKKNKQTKKKNGIAWAKPQLFLTVKPDFAKLAFPAEQLFLQTIPTAFSEWQGVSSWRLLGCYVVN